MSRLSFLNITADHDSETLARNIDRAVVAAGGKPASPDQMASLRAKIEKRLPQTVKAQSEPYKYSSTQIDLPPDIGEQVLALGAVIPDAALAADGREDKPHVTVLYGLHGVDAGKARRVLANEPPITVTFGKTSYFSNSESDSGDVLKVDVESDDLRRLNKRLAKLPHTNTHAGYAPHATIAYLKPGTGKKYAGDSSLEGQTATVSSVTFVSKNGTRVVIPLTGKKPS